MTLDDGHTLSFCDPRRFGTGELAVGADARDDFLDARLGIEPLGPDFTTEHLRILARGRRAPVKAFLLDQRRVAGVGNIYADEALFRAQIHPLTPAGRLKRPQLEALRDAVVSCSRPGSTPAARRSTTSATPTASAGPSSTSSACTPARASRARCAARTIVKLVAAGRGTYVCQNCQRPPRGARVRSRRAAV